MNTSNQTIEKIISHIRNRSYMSGVDRGQLRIKTTGEVFTPTELVQEILNKIPTETFIDSNKTYLDPSCGDGQFLGEVLIRKVENGIDFEQALSTIYGVDIMQDNVNLCRERLLCDRKDLQHIVNKNIVCADATRYHYRFDETPPYQTLSEKNIEKILEVLVANNQLMKSILSQLDNMPGEKKIELNDLKSKLRLIQGEHRANKVTKMVEKSKLRQLLDDLEG